MKKLTLIMLLIGFVSVTGCNTVEGFGKDLQKLGKSIEKKTED
ncbi:MAG: entericidin A/B family lipoprotein [Gammaproteobacteria bacterium]|nr:entericidin A/B family lipoprotein [Gammaproteobacteria bacterium]MCW8909890.1 entericidin A/B family lipoprotein [Gammaproteobacteria bacterium]MCW9004468.1 entericidin A/B family lipoprotein [Gammaproteobacteria bacterium]